MTALNKLWNLNGLGINSPSRSEATVRRRLTQRFAGAQVDKMPSNSELS